MVANSLKDCIWRNEATSYIRYHATFLRSLYMVREKNELYQALLVSFPSVLTRNQLLASSQCFKTKKKAHSRVYFGTTVFLPPREPAYFMHDSGMKWQKYKLWAAHSEDDREISIVRRPKKTVGVLRSSGVQTVLLWNKPS